MNQVINRVFGCRNLLLTCHLIKSADHQNIIHRCVSTTGPLLFFRKSKRVMPKVKREDFWPEPEYTRPKDEADRKISWKESVLPEDLSSLRFKYPEFLPEDDPEYRHPLLKKIERQDMLKRRQVIDIPEFYVGSVLSVTVSDPNAPGKVSRFVGICIEREGQGLRSYFTLRNYIENEGVEIRYDLYNPTIRSITVLKLEKRVDNHLLYLRDADPVFSTFPFDMEPEVHDDNAPVAINELKVRMKPYPWTQHWELEYPEIRGFEKLENVPDWLYIRSQRWNAGFRNRYQKYDLMSDYRMNIPEEDQLKIWSEVTKHENQFSSKRLEQKRQRLLQRK